MDKNKSNVTLYIVVRISVVYSRFFNAAGLRTENERLHVAGFGRKDASGTSQIASNPQRGQQRTTGTSDLSMSKVSGDGSTGSKSWSKASRKAMYSAEYGSVDKQYEVARLYTGDGKRIFKKNGGSSSVRFTAAEIKQMRGGVLTHNHPNGSCFSPEDINMLRHGKLLEVRAVTPQGVYRLQMPSRWSKDISSLDKIKSVYYDIDNQISPSIYAMAARGKITYAQAEAMCQEAVLREFANRYGLGFDFDTWDDIRREIK